MSIFGNDKEGRVYLKAAHEMVRKKLKLITEVMFEEALKRSKESKKRPVKGSK